MIIIEMMGRPKEHLKTSLEEHIAKLEKIKKTSIIKKEFSEPKLIDEKKELYTAFSEVEIECEKFMTIVEIIFDFMPASIEIIEPSKLSLNLDEATSFLNNLTGRLHKYDEFAKIMKNKEIQYNQELSLAKRLLFENKIIDEQGKIIKNDKVIEKEDKTRKKDKKEVKGKNKD